MKIICDAMHKKARIWLESNDVLQPPKAPEPTQGASTSVNNNAPQGGPDLTNIMTYLQQRETTLMQSLADQERQREQRQALRAHRTEADPHDPRREHQDGENAAPEIQDEGIKVRRQMADDDHDQGKADRPEQHPGGDDQRAWHGSLSAGQ